MNIRMKWTLGLTLCLLLGAAAQTRAQATRTWISGVGDDVNPCSRTAPCKTFAGAMSKTAAGGEINCLDPGGFGAVTITKSITLDCSGTFGSILAALTTGVNVNGAGIVVRLRGIQINGAGTGINGIRVVNAARVSIEDTIIDGFTQNGVLVDTSGTGTQVFVLNSSIRNAAANAISGAPVGSTDIWVAGSSITGNGTGLRAGANSTFRISGSTIGFNTTGLSVLLRGQIISFGNNAIDGNTTNGSPSSTVALR